MSWGIALAAFPRLDGSAGDGIHLLWTAPPGAGYSLDGWDIQRRKAVGRPKVQCYALSFDEIEALHRVLRLHTPLADFAVREAACPVLPTPEAAEGPAPIVAAAQGPGCTAYEITLPAGHREVQVRTGVPVVLAVAMRAGKAVAARPSDDSAGTHSVSFENLDVDQVILYCRSTTRLLELCVDIEPKDDDASWAHVALANGSRIRLPADTRRADAAHRPASARSASDVLSR